MDTVRKFRPEKRFGFFLFFILFIFISTTFIAWKISQSVVEKESTWVFENKVNIIENWMEERISIYTVMLYSLQGFFEGSETVTRKDWADYIQKTEIFKKYPGMSSIIFIESVKKDNLDDFENKIKSESSLYSYLPKNFKFSPQAPRDEYYIVNYIEPIEGNESRVGADFINEEKRVTSLELARDTGRLTTTGKLFLKSSQKPGFAIIAPIYKKGAKIESISQRRDALVGYIGIIFKDNELFKAILGKEDYFPFLDIKVYDSKTADENNLIYHHSPKTDLPKNTNLSSERQIIVNGFAWTLTIEANPETQLPTVQIMLPKIILIAGSILSSLFIILALSSLIKNSNLLRKINNQTP